jgi:hypothetical protein
MQELGCPDPDDLRSEVVDRMADELAGAADVGVTDLAAEQSAMLVYLGAGDRVPAGWAGRLLEAQRPDGGWSEGDRPSFWHLTLLAMWTLEGLSGPGSGVPVVVAAAS